MAVMAMAYAFGSITGGGFNPAVAFGISVMGLTTWSGIWLYIVAELARRCRGRCGLQGGAPCGGQDDGPRAHAFAAAHPAEQVGQALGFPSIQRREQRIGLPHNQRI